MANEIKIAKQVFDKQAYTQNSNTQFKYFVDEPVIQDPDTVTELFRLYDKLFFQLPAEGSNSHQTFVEKSSQIYTVPLDQNVIQPLLDEIAELRARLLEANQENLDLLTQLGNG